MEEKEAKRLSLELLESVEVLYLSTIDSNGFPQTRAMGNLRNKEQHPSLAEIFSKHGDDFLIWQQGFGTSTARLGNAAIPEPTSIVLLLTFTVLALARCRMSRR